MSLGASHPVGRLRSPAGFAGRAVRAVSGSAGNARMPIRAFAASRLIVLLAGVGGALALTSHASVALTSAWQHALGPVGYVLSGSANRFDAGYYLGIAGHGYGSMATGRIAFFPLYPLLIALLTPLTGSGVIAGVAISAGCFLAAMVLLHRLTELELGRRAADATVLLLAFSPLSFFFTAVYTESLFLLLSVATMLAARRGRWELACLLAGLATLARPTGVLLAIALAIMRLRTLRRPDRRLAWALVPPATLLGYLGVLVAGGYPWLAPFRAESQWGRVSAGPLNGLAAGLWAAVRGLGRLAGGTASIYHPTLSGPLSQSAESVILFAVLLLAGAVLAACLRRLPLEYGVYAGAALLMCLSSPDLGQPLWSLDRYVLTIFPLWMAGGAWVAARRLERPAVVLGSLLLVFYTVQFSSWSFVA